MKIEVKEDAKSLGEASGRHAARLIREAINGKQSANIILATGASQFKTLETLVSEDIDWSKVVMFHLDEYIGLPESHPASFRKYLKERFIARVPELAAVHLINGEADPAAECIWLGDLISQYPIDVALVGIGENGHLAFNDPPADFDTDEPYIIVQLDDACRRQQLGEGWFSGIEEVPKQAISMSIRQIMRSQNIICSVPDQRKAIAVRDCLLKPVSNLHPASILQEHTSCTVYLDPASASLMSENINAPKNQGA